MQSRRVEIGFDLLVSLLQMLHLRDSESSGGSVIYRRLRKDRSYVTVQATGRTVGTRYVAHTKHPLGSSPDSFYDVQH